MFTLDRWITVREYNSDKITKPYALITTGLYHAKDVKVVGVWEKHFRDKEAPFAIIKMGKVMKMIVQFVADKEPHPSRYPGL